MTTAEATSPAAGAAPARASRIGAWYARQDKRELALWGGLIALAILARVIGLGNRPFHHDESQDAYFSYIFRTTGVYQYDPLLHGPLRFYLTALAYVLFGDGNFTARLAPITMGLLMLPLAYGLRAQLGRIAAFAFAAFLAFGPTYLYFSRFAREDIYFACLTLALIVVIFRFLARPRAYHPALIGLVLALSFSTKETTFITVFVMGSFFLVALAFPQTRRQVWGPVAGVGVTAWGWALAVFAAVFTLSFTTFLTHPHGLWDGVYTGLKYWLSQQNVGRGGEPWYFYLVVLFGEEWPALLLGLIGAVALWRKRSLIGMFLIWDFLLSLAVYSWASEKFAWIVMHPLLPLLALAGVGIQTIWQTRNKLWRGIGIAAAAVALLYSGYSSWLINVTHPANPRELLVSTQSSEQVKQVADQVLALAKDKRGGQPLTVTVDSSEGATFPYAWYFRHLAAGYVQLEDQNAAAPTSDVIIMTDPSHARLGSSLAAGYSEREFSFRVWWVRDYSKMTPANWWRWMSKREVWNPTGGMPEWLLVKKGVS